jgi:hypothetical protein
MEINLKLIYDAFYHSEEIGIYRNKQKFIESSAGSAKKKILRKQGICCIITIVTGLQSCAH